MPADFFSVLPYVLPLPPLAVFVFAIFRSFSSPSPVRDVLPALAVTVLFTAVLAALMHWEPNIRALAAEFAARPSSSQPSDYWLGVTVGLVIAMSLGWAWSSRAR